MLKFWGQCQCQWFSRVNVNTQCQCWPVVIDHRQCQWQCQCLDFPQCQCIEICQWLLTFYNRVNSCDLNVNVNVNSCIQSLTSLNVNGNVNDSKIVNSMSIVNVNTSKKSMSMAPSITLLMSDKPLHINLGLQPMCTSSLSASKIWLRFLVN